MLDCYMDGSIARTVKASLPAAMRKTASKLKADEVAALRILHCARPAAGRRKAA